MAMATLEALIFDVDGTLADTERDGHRLAFNAAFAEAGLDWGWSELVYGDLLSVTGGKERIRYYLEKYNPGFEAPEALEGFIAGLHQAKTQHYLARLSQGEIPLRPGVQRLLEEARAEGLRLAVATTTTPENVTTLLESTIGPEALSWFEVIAAGDVVPAKKPAPDIYLWAMEKLGLGPEQCLALEDSHNGVKAVLGAGIRALVVAVNGYTRHEDFSGATLVVDQLGEPDNPCRALNGDLGAAEMVDVALLRQIHEQAWRD
jgi:HAD superfamily hydrolase (TIGR01509 family)